MFAYTQTRRYADTQIHRCTETQRHRYTDTQIHRYIDTQWSKEYLTRIEPEPKKSLLEEERRNYC